MKIASKFKKLGFALILSTFMFACNQETRQETNEGINEAQTEINEEAVDVNNEYREFDAWVRTNTSRADEVTADEYREMRTEYNRRSAELEAESANWDEGTRQEWEGLKNDWNIFENSVQERLGNIEDVDVDVNVDRNNN